MRKGLTSLLFVLGADIKEFQTELRKSTRDMQKWGRDMEKTGKSMSTYITAPIVAMGTASVIAFRNLNEAMKQVEAGIASTGGAAGYTSDQLKEMADDMGRLTATLNQDILQNVTAQLLTFTNITGNAFEEAQMAALNLSARMGTDLRSSAMMVGRALNDPIQGLTALSRAGVQFTNDQREAVRALVETGDVAAAQTIILQELETQFGGSAEAAGDAFSHMKNASIELGQAYGELISNAILPFVERITEVIRAITDLDDGKKRWILTIGGVAAAIGPMLTMMGYMAARVIPNTLRGINMMVRAFRALRVAMMANPWMAVAAGIAAVAAGFAILNRRGSETTRIMRDLESAAAQSIATQRVEMDQLIRVAQDQNRSDEERIEALKEINRLMPDHIDDLNLASINTDKATTAQEAYVESLMKEARVIAAKEKLVEIERERIKLLLESEQATKKYLDAVESGSIAGWWQQIWSEDAAYKSTQAIDKLDEQYEVLQNIISGSNDYAAALTNLLPVEDDINGVRDEQIGILKQLNEQIKELRDLESQATSVEEIANIRQRIQAKEDEVAAIENQVTALLRLNELLAEPPRRMTGVGMDDTTPGIQPRPVRSPIDPEAIEIMQRYRNAVENAAVANSIFGESFNLVNAEIGATQAAIMQLIELGFDESDEVMQRLIQRLAELQGELGETGISFQDFANVIESGIASAVSAFAEGIGGMIAGTGTLRGAFGGVLGSIASTLEDLGRLAISTGTVIESIRTSLTTLSGFGAIAAGAALIALASIVRSRASSLADNFDGNAVGMAEGGVVPPGYPNDNYPARLTSGEIVVPPKKLESFFQEITQSIVQVVRPAASKVPSETQTINIHYKGAETFAGETFTQFIDQVIHPAKITSPDNMVQLIDQVVSPASITAPDNFTQFIDQIVRPADIASPGDMVQLIDQVVLPASITAPDNFTQFIDQVIHPAEITSPGNMVQMIDQVVSPASITAPDNFTQFIDQIVRPADIASPGDMVQMIDQVVSPASITAPDNFTQFIDQIVRPADIASPGDMVQLIDQVVLPASITAPDNFTQFIDQVIHPAEITSPGNMVQMIDQVVSPASITAPDNFTQFIDQIVRPADIASPGDMVQLIDQVVSPASITAPDNFTQFIDQVIHPAEITSPGNMVQVIDQVVNPATITAPESLTQFIDQVIHPAKITSPGDMVQMIGQVDPKKSKAETHKYIIPDIPIINIPKMAMGGIVPPGFPNDTYPAMLSSGEKVIPNPAPIEPQQEKQGEMVARIERGGPDLVLFLKETERQIENSF